jgi:hypothetical protein
MNSKRSKLSVGDWVEVRSKAEILRTLDSDGQLDGMPFMPEMFAFCGKRLEVYKRAHKTCDTVFPVRGRRVDRAVHLDTRCDGSAHGGCQASCLIFWREEWLKPASSDNRPTGGEKRAPVPGVAPAASGCTEAGVLAHAHTLDPNDGEPTYVCQATRLPYATKPLEWWDIRQYVEDYWSGNVSLWRIICGGAYSLYNHLTRAGIGGPTMWRIYDKLSPLWGGTRFPRRSGTIPQGQPTPAAALNLQPGELVRIKSHDEILKTLDVSSRNRGLYWDAEEVPYCGGTYRVLRRVAKIVNERTGKMREMKTPCIILDSVVCQSRYSECRMFCPRSIYSYWREIWLERMEMDTPGVRPADCPAKEQLETVSGSQ